MAFYVGDYVADTLHLAREHHGSYLLLILAAFKNAGWLPNDDGFLAQIAKCTPKQWKAERHIYARFFAVDDERWVHNRVTRELERSNEITAKRQRAGIASAAKRQQTTNTCSTHVGDVLEQTGRPSQSQSHSQVTTTPSVTTGGSAVRASLLPEGWEPTEADLAELRKGRPEIVGDLYAKRMQDFRDWTKANAKTSHDWTATWRGFMRQTKLPPESKFAKPADASTLPPSEPWEQRVRGYKPGGFWKPNDWGPPPESPSTRVPAPILATWRQGADA